MNKYSGGVDSFQICTKVDNSEEDPEYLPYISDELRKLVGMPKPENDLKNDDVFKKEIKSELKDDLKEIESELKNDLKEIESELKNDLKEIESELKNDLKKIENIFMGQIQLLLNEIKSSKSKDPS
ncbi:12310_t:CDS:2 [Entrophospora sp. SA101]|nr:12310_t:CDS:2 [Entrophospora sp. SA101]